jgi:signal transduction histidine kinase
MKIPLRVSLTFFFCLVFLLGVCLLEVGTYFGLSVTMTDTVDEELKIRLHGFDGFLAEHLPRMPVERVLRDLPVHVTLQPELAIVQDAQGRTLFCGSLVEPLCAAPLTAGTPKLFSGGRMRTRTSTHRINGAEFRLLVARDLAFQRSLLARFRLLSLLIMPLALSGAAAGGYWLSGRALAPVREIIRSVHAINDRSLSLRLRIPCTGDEIQHLSETLNGMLTRVESSFRQVTDLTANASHELRMPLAIIRTASEIALLDINPTLASYRRSLLQVCSEAEKSTRLLDSLLLLAQSDSGTHRIELTPVSLPESVYRTTATYASLADAKGLTLRLDNQLEDSMVWADPVQLQRLWSLLIDNAIKYTPAGGLITVTTRYDRTGAPVCEFVDSGIGISEADLPRIFDRFFRSENARAAYEGSGLGLAIGSWIVSALRARIEVHSALGIGSTFCISFPGEASERSHAVQGIADMV